MNRKKFVLDGLNFNSLDSFYDEVEKVLTKNLDWKIGRNFNALDDILWGGFGAFEDEEPIDLIWKNSNKSKDDLGYHETIRELQESLKECNNPDKSAIEKKIEDVKNKTEPTIFESLIELIIEHENVNLILE